MNDKPNETSAVESEHQRLTKQLCKATWEKGFEQGARKRLRSAIETAVRLIQDRPPLDTLRFLEEVLALDDQINETKLREVTAEGAVMVEYPADHPAPGDLGSVPL